MKIVDLSGHEPEILFHWKAKSDAPTFGRLLLRYIDAGGLDWGEFLSRVCQKLRLSQRELSRKVGIDHHTINSWINEKDSEKSQKPALLRGTVNKFIEAFFLNGEEADALAVFTRGNLALGTTHAKAVLRLQTEMAKLRSTERSVFGNEVLNQLIERSGMTPSEIAEVSGCDQSFICKQRHSKKPVSALAIPIMARIAKAITPQSSHEELSIETHLLFLGIPQYRKPADMLKLVRKGRMTIEEMIKEYRMQLALHQRGFCLEIGIKGKVNSRDLFSLPILRKIATHMELTETQRVFFMNKARGKDVSKDSLSKWIQKAEKGDASFADIVKFLLDTKFGLESDMLRENAGIKNLAEALGVKRTTVESWLKGNHHIGKEALARTFATVAGVSLKQRKKLIQIAMDALPRYNSDILANFNGSSAQERRGLFSNLLKQARKTRKELASELKVAEGTLYDSLKTGFWRIQKVPVGDVAAALIPEEYPDDRSSFCAIYTEDYALVA